MTTTIEPGWACDAEGGLRAGVHVVLGEGRVLDVTHDRRTVKVERIAIPDGAASVG